MMKKNKFLKVVAGIWGLSGIVILTGVIWPIISYRTKNSSALANPVSTEVDFTRASNWFSGGATADEFSKSKVMFYTLSIPKLKIENATVTIGGEDLAKSLIQYPGTALPGKQGNAVIFGHSVLPIFYDPKDYLSIFSTLPTIKTGDEVLVNYDNISFVYQVESVFEVHPTDIQVLQQDPTDSFLTLVTCVPPGDPRRPRRLIVRARVVPPEQNHGNLRS